MNHLKIKPLFALVVIFELFFMALIVYTQHKNALLKEALYQAQNERFAMIRAADMLRQSSDDLTRFARTYAVTGDRTYRDNYYRVLDIRNGKAPMPQHYESIYWDYLEPLRSRLHPDGEPQALDAIMNRLPYSSEEYEKLRESHRYSDQLVRLEEEASHAMEGRFKGEDGNYTVRGAPDRERAISLLYSQAYHRAKERIMQPIDAFILMLDARTEKTVQQIELQTHSVGAALQNIIILFVPANIIIFILLYRYIRTAYRHVEEAGEQVSNIMENAADGIVVFDAEGKILRFNRAAERLFDYRKEALIGSALELLVPELHRARLLPGITRLVGTTREVQALRRDKTLLPVAMRVSAMQSREGTIYTALMQDITERKAAEREMIRAKETAEAAAQVKSDFMANVSHELRTPMNTILGMSYLALEGNLDPKPRHYIEKVHRAAESLQEIITDILDFSRLDSGSLKLEQRVFGLEEVMEELESVMKADAQEKGVAVRFVTSEEIPATLVGDPVRLRQLLSKLCSNAVKFTESGGRVDVSVALKEVLGKQVRLVFAVQDSGIGMSREEQAKLFAPFAQADTSSRRKYGGLGLGLVIAHDLAEAMHGSIRVESEIGQGSRFEVTLPFDVPQGSLPPKAPQRTEEPPGPRASAVSRAVFDGRRTLRTIDAMMQLSEACDTAVLQQLALLQKVPGMEHYREELAVLERTLKRYDFDEALRLLQILKQHVTDASAPGIAGADRDEGGS